MFLPITHERMVVTRWPWVALTMIALCTIVFPLTHWSRGEEESEERFEAAVRVWVESPQLEVDPRLLPKGLQREIRSEVSALLAEQGVASETGEGTQEELDQRTGEWLASLERAPLWRYGLVPARRTIASGFTHMFLHGGLLHLLGNLFVFYLVAPAVEDAVGRGKFLALYLGCGWIAGQAYALHYPDLFRPMIGASGAIAAVMGAFLVLYGRVKLRYLLWIGLPLGTFEAPAWLMFPTWVISQVVAGLGVDAGSAATGGVAYWAHTWGFAAGAVVGFVLRKRATPLEVAREDPVERSRRLLAKGRRDDAWQLLRAEARRDPGRGDVARALWDLAKEVGRAEEAAPMFVRLIRAAVREGDPLLAARRWQELRGALRLRPADPALAAHVAEALARAGEGREAQEELLEAGLAGLSATTPPEVVAQLLARAVERPSAALRGAIGSAAERADLPAPMRGELGAARAQLGVS